MVYITLLYSLYVPDWEYQIQGPGSTINTFLVCSDFLSLGHLDCILFYEILLIIYFIQVKCGVRGDTGPACNAVGMIDRKIMGIKHLYRRPVYGRMKVCIYAAIIIILLS